MPSLAAFAKEVVHCGPLGAGMATKIVRNVVTYGSWTVVAQAALLAASLGISPALLLRVIDVSDPGGDTPTAWLRLQVGVGSVTADDSRHIAELLEKDMSGACQLAASRQLDVELLTLIRHRALDTLAVAAPPIAASES